MVSAEGQSVGELVGKFCRRNGIKNIEEWMAFKKTRSGKYFQLSPEDFAPKKLGLFIKNRNKREINWNNFITTKEEARNEEIT